MSEFRLGLLNPNTNRRDTDAMQAIAEEALGPGCRVVALTAATRARPNVDRKRSRRRRRSRRDARARSARCPRSTHT